jgi:hypothetical protein
MGANLSKFEWTESGRELLLQFECLIQINGGCEKLAEIITAEAVKTAWQQKRFRKNGARPAFYRVWSQLELDYILAHKKEITYKNMGKYLGRSESSVRDKLKVCKC